MSKSTVKIPFKKSTSKKSPYNFNEIDVNLLLQNPTHIHKMLDKDCEDDEKSMVNVNKNAKPLKNYMEQDEEDDIPEFARISKLNYGKKVKPNKFGKALNDGVSNFQNIVVSGFKKGKNLGKSFINDVEKDGFGNTVKSRAQLIEDLIGEFIENNEALDKFEKVAKPGADFIQKFKTKGSLEKEAEQTRDYPRQRAEREERLRKWRKDSSNKQ